MLAEYQRKEDDHRAVRNVTRLTVLLVVSLWAFFAYWAVSTRQEAISTAGNGLLQMAHAVEQYSTNLLKMAEVFQVTAERWLDANSSRDPRTDAGFTALVDDFRKRTDNLIDIRLASANGDLYYFPNGRDGPRDNVADREYFKAVIDAEPGLRHIGIPVLSRVSGQWRLPVTVRMKRPQRGLEVINALVDLSALISAFESERSKPNGTIGLWKTDGTLLVRQAAGNLSETGQSPLKAFGPPSGHNGRWSALTHGPHATGYQPFTLVRSRTATDAQAR